MGFIKNRRRQLKRKKVLELLNSGSTSNYTGQAHTCDQYTISPDGKKRRGGCQGGLEVGIKDGGSYLKEIFPDLDAD